MGYASGCICSDSQVSVQDVPINQLNVFLLASAAENINHIDILSRDIFYKCGVFIRNTILFDATFAERVSEEDRQVFELLAGMDILDAHLAIRTNATTGIAQTSVSPSNISVGIGQNSSKETDKNENLEDKDDNSNNLDNHIIQNSTVHDDATDIVPDSANSIFDADAISQNEENASARWIDKFEEMVNNTNDSKEMANHATDSQDSGEDSNISNAENTQDGNIHFTKTKLIQDAADAGDPKEDTGVSKEDTGDPKEDTSGGPVEKIIDTSTNNLASAISAEDSSLDGDSVGITTAAIDSVNEAQEVRRLVPCVSENQVIQVESLAYYRATKWKRLTGRTDESAGPPSVEYGKMLRPPYHLMSLLRFKSGAAKGYSFTDKNTMIFVVLRGELVVTIHETDITVKKGDCFYVPTKNGYNIVNEGEATAELALVQYQYDGPLPQGQLLG